MSTPKNIVKNASKGYGYTYSNLADLAKAGIGIPPMKTQKVDGDEYVFAKIGEDWIQGAKVVELEMKGMNAAQAYGSSLTYARRYTVQLVLGIACDDDDKVEQDGAALRKQAPNRNGVNFQEIQDELKLLDDMDSVMSYYKSLPLDGLSDKQVEAVNKMFAYRKKQLGF